MHTATRVLGSNQWMEVTSYYDNFGRVIRTESNNPLLYSDNQAEVINYTYDMADNLLTQTRTHSSGTDGEAMVITERTEYDHSGRAKLFQQTLDGTTFDVSEFHYSPKDEVATKFLGRSGGGSWLQQVDYDYLPNGFLRSINGGGLIR